MQINKRRRHGQCDSATRSPLYPVSTISLFRPLLSRARQAARICLSGRVLMGATRRSFSVCLDGDEQVPRWPAHALSVDVKRAALSCSPEASQQPGYVASHRKLHRATRSKYVTLRMSLLSKKKRTGPALQRRKICLIQEKQTGF